MQRNDSIGLTDRGATLKLRQLEVLLAGVGASFLSSVAVGRDLERGDLEEIPLEGVVISRPFFSGRRSGRGLTPVGSAFRELMSATLAVAVPS